MSNPLVSVIVPTKNSSEFLEAWHAGPWRAPVDGLKFIRSQTYKNIELIVVDKSYRQSSEVIGYRLVSHGACW